MKQKLSNFSVANMTTQHNTTQHNTTQHEFKRKGNIKLQKFWIFFF